MYLVDAILSLEPATRRAVGMGFSLGSPRAEAIAGEIGDCELYALEPSALAVAADIRADTPERLDQMAIAVFTKPRRVFVEADYAEIMAVFARFTGYETLPMQPMQSMPQRLGLLIVCGEGRARITACWSFPPDDIRDLVSSSSGGLTYSKEDRAALVTIASTSIAAFDLTIDPAAPAAFPDFAVFRAAAEASGEAADFAERLISFRAGAWGGSEDSRWRAVWLNWRLNEIARPHQAPETPAALNQMAMARGVHDKHGMDEIMEAAIADYNGEVLRVVAYMALLSARAPEIVAEPRDVSKLNRARRRAGKPTLAGNLSVVRVDLDDLDLARAHREAARGGAVASVGEEQIEGHGLEGHGRRARHFVRGHLFKARNGLIVYRRPHWRGDATLRSIKVLSSRKKRSG